MPVLGISSFDHLILKLLQEEQNHASISQISSDLREGNAFYSNQGNY